MTAERSEARLRLLRQAMDADAMMVRDTSNIRWLTDFDDVFDEERAHALLVTSDNAVLHTDSRYSGACRAAAVDGPVAIADETVSHAVWAARQVAGGSLAIEDSISLSEFRALEAAFAPDGGAQAVALKETSGCVVKLRAVKDDDEIGRLRMAQAITDAAFAHIVGFMKPGMTERAVQVELEGFMQRRGASGLAFPSIVATGANAAKPHAIPGETKLEAGQCVVLDFGARARGYCSDMTRTVFLGQPSAKLADAYAAIREANETVEAHLKPGMTGAEAQQMAEDILANHGFGGMMGHGLGHGVGIDIHEQPVLSLRGTTPLEEGNVVTVEPGIYRDGHFGMRLEDFGVITATGYQVFTQSAHDMVII